MTSHQAITEVFNDIENQTNFCVRSEADIVTLLRNNLPENHEPLQNPELWEFYAFLLIENSPQGHDRWGTYFGSPSLYVETGEVLDRVPLENITCTCIQYWEERLQKSKNALLVARYAGLVWEFKLKVCNVRPGYQEIAIPYIENLLTSVKQGMISSFPACREKLRRALSLSRKLKNNDLKDQSIAAVLSFQETNVKHQAAGTWRMSYDLLISPGVVDNGSPDYNRILSWLEKWFTVASEPDQENKVDVNAAEVAFEPLLTEYLKSKDDEKIQILLAKMEACYEHRINVCSAGEAMHWLEKMKSYFLQAKNKHKAEQIDVRLEKLGPRLIAEMKVIRAENTFSKDIIDHITEEILRLPLAEIYPMLPTLFMADTSEIVKKKVEGGNHISDILSKGLYNKSGRKVATVGSIDEDQRGRAIQEVQLQMNFSALLLHFILKGGKERNIFTAESLVHFVSTSVAIATDRRPIFEKAFQAWLAGDYVVALHLLIPQIEAACLLIAKNAGKAIIRPNKFGGYNVLLFGDLLRDNALLQTLGKDGVDYFATLFTDPRGLNLRNEVAHGLRDYDGFDENVSNTVLIALFHLVNCTQPIS